MAAGAHANGAISAAKTWMRKNETELLLADAAILGFLFLFHMLDPSVVPLPPEAVNIGAIVLVGFLFFTIAWKGLIPAAISILGVVLLHNAIILPYYPPSEGAFMHLLINQQSGSSDTERAAGVAFTMHFLLGIGMVALAIMVAYAPRLLFTRNRPEEKDPTWSKYPIWYDNVKLAGRYSEPLVPARSLMEPQDRYLLWRYEYVLASIYGTHHLVRPDGLVPSRSTEFVRDRASGLLMGKGRFNGYFV
ncbi:hypothetical protein [Nitrososphaera sp.]|uniref:hypothetical protein n=1 Tax=Nitrososphaera sp. TaxID=1971748 RepID=UPI003178648D